MERTENGFILKLGMQTTAGELAKEIQQRIANWRTKACKSYTILSVVNTDYHGRHVDYVTGYANIKVQYFNNIQGDVTFDAAAGKKAKTAKNIHL
jgi:hypothetical protein